LARSDLLGPRGPRSLTSNSDDPYDERSERARLLTGTEILSDGGRRLTDSTRLALETEEQGADILRTLRVQREQIENSRDMVRVAAGPNHILSSSYLTLQVRTSDSHIDRAAGTLKGMIVQ
jgi:vesicle transport through interaction with t-SNAREs protein 1